MVINIWDVPSTIVVSDTTFSASGRVIDAYGASVAPKMVQMLMCPTDWVRSLHEAKMNNKVNV